MLLLHVFDLLDEIFHLFLRANSVHLELVIISKLKQVFLAILGLVCPSHLHLEMVPVEELWLGLQFFHGLVEEKEDTDVGDHSEALVPDATSEVARLILEDFDS